MAEAQGDSQQQPAAASAAAPQGLDAAANTAAAAADDGQQEAPAAAGEPSAQQNSIRAHLASFARCRDFPQMHEVNLLSSQLGMGPMFPLLDSQALEATLGQLSDEGWLQQLAKPSTLPPGMEEVPGYLAGFAEFDEAVLLDEDPAGPTAGSSSPPPAAAAGATAADVEAAAEAAAVKAADILANSGIASPKRKRNRVSAAAAAAAAAVAADSDDVVAGSPSDEGRPPKRQQRQASRGVAALTKMEAQLLETDDEADAEMVDGAADAADEVVDCPSQFVEQAAAAAIAKVAAAAQGGAGGSSSQRRMPGWVRQRVPTPRKLHARDFIAPVSTTHEQDLFRQLLELHSSSSGTVKDWTAFTRDWNIAAYQNLCQPLPDRQQLTFKQASHLKAYDAQLAKSAQQLHTAALSQLGTHMSAAAAAAAAGEGQQAALAGEQQAEEQQAEEQRDVSMQLRGILSECIQQLGGLDERIPGILQELVTASAGGQGRNGPAAGQEERTTADTSEHGAHVAAGATRDVAAVAAGGGGMSSSFTDRSCSSSSSSSSSSIATVSSVLAAVHHACSHGDRCRALAVHGCCSCSYCWVSVPNSSNCHGRSSSTQQCHGFKPGSASSVCWSFCCWRCCSQRSAGSPS